MKICLLRSVLIAFSLWGIHFIGFSQAGVGLNSPKIRWNQIDSEHYQVIFPEDRYNDAQRVASLIDLLISNDSLLLQHPKVKIPIILQNQTVIPNGFVTLGPWRSEYNLTPPQFQFAGITPWLDMLTIHEYRHVQQVANARVGWAGKLLRTVFGQGGWAFYNRAIQPQWFLEGDAVYAETILSNGGRGRSPDFEREYRALRLEGPEYHYEKASFRSFKNFIPSHYHLGYHMTTYARREFGKDVWDEILADTYSKPGLYRFSKSVKQATGFSTKQLYKASMMDLDKRWRQQEATIKPMDTQLKSEDPQNVFTNYRYPNYLEDGSILVQKSSLNQVRTIYQIRDQEEKKIFLPGVSLNEHFSVNANKVVWSEIRFHPRWSNQTYSIIREYDLKSGRFRKVTQKSKLSAPALSPDGAYIAAVEANTDGKNYLIVLDSDSGKEHLKISLDSGHYISFPRWQEDNRNIIVPGRNSNGNFLRSYDIQTKSWRELIPEMEATIDRIFPKGDFVYFSSSLTGIQNIFALKVSTSEFYQITESRFGSFDPAISKDGKKLVYSEYTAKGFRTTELVLNDALWRQPIIASSQGSNYFSPLLDTEHGNILDEIEKSEYFVKPYKYFTKGLLNIHSWYPFITTEEFGFGFLSKNIMSTLSLTGQFSYNTNEDSWKTLGRVSYGTFFPILDIEISTGERQSTWLLDAADDLNLYVGQWKEHTFSGGIRLPFNITHGNYPSSVTLSSKYRHYIVDYLDPVTDRARNENFGSVDMDFSFQRAQTRAHRNIYPRWAQSVRVNYQKTLGENENQGELFTINSSLFFPGAFNNHSLFLTGGYQQEDIINAYRFEDLFTNARGYSSFPFENIFRVSANYTLPIWYPDFAAGSIAYFKRLRGNAFYDYSQGTLLEADLELRSYGLELVVDFRLIRLVEIGAGVRLGRKVDENENFAEFFISSLRF